MYVLVKSTTLSYHKKDPIFVSSLASEGLTGSQDGIRINSMPFLVQTSTKSCPLAMEM